jgi:hypothetical protein
LLIGTPAKGFSSLHPKMVESIRNLEIPSDVYHSWLIVSENRFTEKWKNVAYNMEIIRKFALGFDELLMVDSDIVIPKDAYITLKKYDADIVLGLYNERKSRYGSVKPLISYFWNGNDCDEYIKRGEAFVVKGYFPTGFMLVRGKALNIEFYPSDFDMRLKIFGVEVPAKSADIPYSKKVHDYGLKVVCAPVWAKHIDVDGVEY